MRQCLLVLVILLNPPIAVASDFDDWFEVYREDFVGESAIPTSPEIDEMGAGGVSTYDEPAGLAPPPLLTGDALRLFTNGLTTSQQRVDAFPTTLGTSSLGIRGRFDALEASVVNEPVTLTTNATFEADAGGLFYGVGVGIRFVPDPPNAPRVFLVLGESEFDPFGSPQITSRTIENELDPATADLVQHEPFSLELTVQRVGSGLIYGTLHNAAGILEQGIGDLALTDFSTQAVARISTSLTAEVSGSTAQVDVTELAVFGPFTTQVTAVVGDAVDANPGDGVCATSTGACTLRAAIQEANATPGPGRIELGPFEYVLTIGGDDEDAAATGDLDILDDLEIFGAGHLGTTFTMVDASGLDRVFHVPDTALDRVVRIRDMRIEGGYASTAQGAYGGGIASAGRLTLERVSLVANIANVGGGIFNARTLWLTDSLVAGNLAQTLFLTGRGGGVAGGSLELGAQTFNSHTEILRSGIIDNESTAGGAGVDFARASTADVRSSTVARNLGTDIFSHNSPLVLDHATIVSNTGTGIETILAQGASSARFVQSVVSGTPACTLSTFPVFQTFYEGHNASSDASCGFTAPGSLENVDPMLTLGDSVLLGTIAWVPDPGSPLIDAGDPAIPCPVFDQSLGPRPLDGDANGSSVCDIGAIEVPEPGFALALATAGLILAARRPRFDRLTVGGRHPTRPPAGRPTPRGIPTH